MRTEIKALLVDDDERLTEALSEYLRDRAVAVDLCHRLDEARRALRSASYDVLILDLMLPDGDGIDFCRELREQEGCPILILSARGEATDRILGLEMGADDYLAKPFDPAELVARLKALVRRGPARGAQTTLIFDDLEIDRRSRTVQLNAKPCDLTSYQFDLLVELASQAGRVVSRERLMSRLRGSSLGPYDRSIDIQISRLRAALEDDAKRPKRILTIRGAGYLFVMDSK